MKYQMWCTQFCAWYKKLLLVSHPLYFPVESVTKKLILFYDICQMFFRSDLSEEFIFSLVLGRSRNMSDVLPKTGSVKGILKGTAKGLLNECIVKKSRIQVRRLFKVLFLSIHPSLVLLWGPITYTLELLEHRDLGIRHWSQNAWIWHMQNSYLTLGKFWKCSVFWI